MTQFLLLVLVAAWIVVFVPAVRRAKEASPYPATRRFKRSMNVVSPANIDGTWIITPRSAREHAKRLDHERRQRRRRNIFFGLLGLAAVTFLGALGSGGGWLEAHLAIDGVLCGYIAWLIEARNRRFERSLKVRRLRPAPQSIEIEELRTGT